MAAFRARSGLLYANSELKVRGDRPIYCPPPHMPLTADGVVEILRSFVNQHSFMGELRLGAVTVSAFKFTFPSPTELTPTVTLPTLWGHDWG